MAAENLEGICAKISACLRRELREEWRMDVDRRRQLVQIRRKTVGEVARDVIDIGDDALRDLVVKRELNEELRSSDHVAAREVEDDDDDVIEASSASRKPALTAQSAKKRAAPAAAAGDRGSTAAKRRGRAREAAVVDGANDAAGDIFSTTVVASSSRLARIAPAVTGIKVKDVLSSHFFNSFILSFIH